MTPDAGIAASPAPPALVAEIDALLIRLLVEGPGAITKAEVEELASKAAAAGFHAASDQATVIAGRMLEKAPFDLSGSLASLKGLLNDAGDEAHQEIQGTPAIPQAALKSTNMSADLELLADFVVESREHLTVIESRLLLLEQDPANFEEMHAIFRAFHTIKGMAGFLELESVQRLAHEVETLLDLARNGKLAITPGVVDVVLQSADHLRLEVDAVDRRVAGHEATAPALPAGLMEAIKAAMAGDGASSGQSAAALPANGLEEVLESLPSLAGAPPTEMPLKKAEDSAAVTNSDQGPKSLGPETAGPATRIDILAPGPGASLVSTEAGTARNLERRSADAPAPPARSAEAGKPAESASATVRVETNKLDHLLEMIGEMVIAQSLVQHHPALAALNDAQLAGNMQLLGRITKDLQNATMGVRMIPIGQLFHRSSRVVRDLSRRAGKDVSLQLSGEETEVDRKIAEELSDPLLHMIRNALDHGIEMPAERTKTGKSPAATLRLAAYHQGGQVVVEISDDGRGLNRERILKKAIQNGLLPPDDPYGEQLPDEAVYQLIFEPGFSTAEKITDISGRGVGMDVVRKQVQKLRGRIDIRSAPGAGTQFLLRLPLTLAIIDALIVKVGQQRYLLPVGSVKQIFRPQSEMLSTVTGKSEMVLFQDRLMPVVRLYERFAIEPRTVEPAAALLIEVESDGRSFCLLVDDLLGRQEVVMKSLGEAFKGVPGVSSCAILGDGRVGLILDVAGVFSGVNR